MSLPRLERRWALTGVVPTPAVRLDRRARGMPPGWRNAISRRDHSGPALTGRPPLGGRPAKPKPL